MKKINGFGVYQLRIAYKRVPFYIGKGTPSRPDNHFSEKSLSYSSHKNSTIKRAFAKGRKVYVEWLHQDVTDGEAQMLERYYIALHGRANNGTGTLTNLTDGGDGGAGYVMSAENRALVSKLMKGRKLSAETIAKMCKPKSAEHRANISLAQLGRKREPYSIMARMNMSAGRIGKKHSPETIEKLRQAALRRGACPPEVRDKISRTKRLAAQLIAK